MLHPQAISKLQLYGFPGPRLLCISIAMGSVSKQFPTRGTHGGYAHISLMCPVLPLLRKPHLAHV